MSPLDRTSSTEQETGRTRRFTVRLSWEAANYLFSVERPGHTVTNEIESCVRARMVRAGAVKR